VFRYVVPNSAEQQHVESDTRSHIVGIDASVQAYLWLLGSFSPRHTGKPETVYRFDQILSHLSKSSMGLVGVWVTRYGADVTRHRMDALTSSRDNPGLGRYTFPAFNKASTPRYIVLWDLHWNVLECLRLEAAADLVGAMTATITRLAADGWHAEGTAQYVFVFIRRKTERRRLMLTPHDPHDTAPQSFNPFL
jgi:hypothetical protein